VYDDPRVALEPLVLSESTALAQAETTRRPRHGVKSLVGASVGVRSAAQDGDEADAGRTRAAEGILVANFLLLKSDGSISGFAKNGDTIKRHPRSFQFI
jgi:hypothetical protein